MWHFSFALQDLVRELARGCDAHIGSEEHYELIWNLCKQHPVFSSKGCRTKFGRWASWLNANKLWHGRRVVFLLVLIFMGIKQGWFTSASDVMIARAPTALPAVVGEDGALSGGAGSSAAQGASSSSSSGAAAGSASSSGTKASAGAASSSSSGAGAPAGTASSSSSGLAATVSSGAAMAGAKGTPPPPRTVKDSNEQMRLSRGRCANTLHFVAKVLANRFGNQLCDVVAMCTQPFATFFDMGKTITKTPQGSLAWHIDLAVGSFGGVLRQAFGAMADAETLHYIGFLAPSDFRFVEASESDQDCALAQKMLELIMSESFHWLMSTMTWSDSLPGAFLPLLSRDEQARKACLQKLEEWFKVLCRLEQTANTDPRARQFVNNLLWPLETYPREILIMLSETSFQEVTKDIVELVEGFGKSWLQTNIDEDIMNKLRTREAAHSAGRLGSNARWHCCVTSGVIENYGRTLIQPTTASKTLPCVHPSKRTYHEANPNNFSMGKESFDVMDDLKAYPHISPAGIKLRGPAWLCARAFKGDYTKVSQCWRSLLISPGMLVHDASEVGGKRGCYLHNRT